MLTGGAAREEKNRDIAAADSEQQRDSAESRYIVFLRSWV